MLVRRESCCSNPADNFSVSNTALRTSGFGNVSEHTGLEDVYQLEERGNVMVAEETVPDIDACEAAQLRKVHFLRIADDAKLA